MAPCFFMEESMSALGSIDEKLYILNTILTNASTFPYSIPTNIDVRGISIANDSTSAEITVTITYMDNTTLAIPLGISRTFEARINRIKTVNTSGSSTNYKIALFSRG